MQKLSKDGQVSAFEWRIPQADETVDASSLAQSLVPVAQLADLPADSGAGVLIGPADELEAVKAHIQAAPIVAVDFPAFADGRGFSQARWVREKCGYSGELVAVGNFMQDQLWHLKRCGFDAFVVADDANIESMQISINDFSDAYQASADQPLPLFRRRTVI